MDEENRLVEILISSESNETTLEAVLASIGRLGVELVHIYEQLDDLLETQNSITIDIMQECQERGIDVDDE